ncbi:RusA family crossover junction endodeoxyribonuclease [Xanthobacter sp. TB0136]|uniref:RusA family crossover junction endodeoxyribonuclease n=1 Tax=Xanthobacter sp. TB0136 TaxID=3459177 RepID=UPI00403A0667
MAAPVVINLPGVPRGKARPRLSGRGVYSDKKSAAFETDLGWAAKAAMAGRDMLEGPLHVDIAAYMPVPVSWSKKKKADALAWKIFPTGKPDLDNIIKGIDGLNKIVFRDDAQIVSTTARKVYAADPSLTIVVSEIAT